MMTIVRVMRNLQRVGQKHDMISAMWVYVSLKNHPENHQQFWAHV